MMGQPHQGAAQHGSAHAVRASLLHAISRDGLAATGGRLPTEREICQTMGVSRRAVRRALESLEAEGLIWRRQGKGTFAGQPPAPAQQLAAGLVGETTFAEVMAARLCLEPCLAGMAARRALPADIERMRNLAQRAVACDDPESVELWDSALHRLIARTAANAPLLAAFSMLDEIRGNAAWRSLRARARSMKTLQVSDREHTAIIDAIESGQAERAEAAMRAHLTTLSENVRRILAPDPSTGE